MTLTNVPAFMMLPPPRYPEEVCQAVQTAALAEARWKMAHYHGSVLRWDTNEHIERAFRMVLQRYKDILYGWQWACYVDRIDHGIRVYLVRDLTDVLGYDTLTTQEEREFRSHFRALLD